ncbi:hypothetical protein DEO72_LG8g1723 [Vigna unguiculata]|uniref:Uncharacterized protein n=1 Tax=Vigna unguiculata TaxID=3917 RepID=A0A4D6MRK8_VIGUN|nr:hypothetical protein DEO72_LG8g1723 [Vigna unguiculata]
MSICPSQVPPLSGRASLVRIEAPSSYFQVKTVAGTDKLAQASWSCLGEINRGSPKPFFHEWSPRRPTVILSERASRPGERVHNSLGSLGEPFRVALQWSGRNSMAPVSGCPWYPPQVRASAESDQVICIRMSRVES